ncbi:GNAT family N-acetyltransferase [Vibrio bivalvicida]|uniref:GNAT family N-acetyltransferase n=1 Tax=Vibrio bivalvicida TaxID=1276888 RepID=A0ABV4MHK9_9VIBR
MKLTLITLKDTDELLEFELANQAWFEAFIPPHEEGFYSQEGVQQHIREFLLDYQCNEMVPLLIKNGQNQIIGRINLTNIDSVRSTAHLGYRVGKASINRGVAKWAVSEVTKIVKDKGINKLFAYAATENPASQNVLTSNGFQPVKVVHDYAELHGESIDCIEFKLLVR